MARRMLALVTALLLVASLPLAAFAGEYDLSEGSVTITANESGQTVKHGDNEAVSDAAPIIKQKDSGTSTGNTITIKTEDNATANVTIEDVNISANKPGIEVGGSNLNLTVKGENKIKNTIWDENGTAGVHLDYDGNLTITGNGKLDVETGSGSSAGIGTNGGNGLITGSITIAGNAQVSGTSWGNGAGIGTGNGGKMDGSITIADNAQVTGTSKGGAGIGSGVKGEMSGTITIDDTAHVTARVIEAKSGACGAGIGCGGYGDMSGTISISEKATVNASIGAGDNGKMSGTLTYFEPQPEPTQPAPAKISLYRVLNERGEPLSCTKELADGVLTITVDADYAKLIGTVLSLKTLEKQGVTTIVLVTKAATSTFTLADLQAKGIGTYTLTHDGATVTFTLAKADVSDILK